MSAASNTVDRLLKTLDATWNSFQDSYSGLTDEELLEPGVTGAWSVRDLIAHVTWWEEEALTHLPLILAGGRPPRYSVKYGGIDAFNALMTERKRDLPLDAVRTEFLETHRRLVEYIKSVPPDELKSGTRFRRRLRLDTYGHYPIHTKDILSWRDQRLAG